MRDIMIPDRLSICLLVGFAIGGFVEQLSAAGQLPEVVPLNTISAAVSLDIQVNTAGAIKCVMHNNTDRKIGNVEVLVEYAWIWANDYDHADDDPSWSTTYTLPVELFAEGSVPVHISPLYPLSDRNDGHYLVSAKVVGYTRYRWVTGQETN